MFRPLTRSVQQTAQKIARQARSNSSQASSGSSDTRWMVASVAVTIPALGYLLAPPATKAQAHKAVHSKAAEIGLTDMEPEEAESKIDDEHHGPDSRSNAKGKQQSPESKREQAKENTSGSAQSGDDKAGREDGATKPTGGDIKSKQSGLSNTETKHMVPVISKAGDNPMSKSSETIEPRNPGGTEKEGPKHDASDEAEPEDDKPEADAEAPADDKEAADGEEEKKSEE